MAKQKTAAEKAAERVNAPEQKEQVEVIQTKTLKEVAKVPALQVSIVISCNQTLQKRTVCQKRQ